MTAIDVLRSSEESNNEDECEDENSEEGSNVESDNADNESSDEESPELANAGWADAISRILKSKPKGKKIVLSKAKKLTDVKKVQPKPAGFEILTTEGDVREEKIETEEVKLPSEEPPRKKKKEISSLRVKPDILEKDRERILQKIATKGVVQLFNAVRAQQKDISKQLEEAGPLEVRKEKVLKNIDKRAFLDVLMGEKSQRVEGPVEERKKEKKSVEKESTWSVLQDDFMMGAKMKDWDKELETEEIQELEMESD
ncbi:unnamed protein product [Phaedon cochleariae]|uniref:RRP15-like protein n=1 Tax=Phaedon cochleariae TaxID=80249 RepID=A0A9P0DKA0_PHACE|nr:unnamed protein product [Phaedon cochleariae]